MKKIIILRGISGSGKDFTANKIIHKDATTPYVYMASADEWFTDNKGVYTFDATELGKAHSWCKLSVEQFVRNRPSFLAVVANTSTTHKEIRPYVEIAAKYGVTVEIVEPAATWRYNPQECHKKNIHGVPLSVIESQLTRLQANPIACGTYKAEDLIDILKNRSL